MGFADIDSIRITIMYQLHSSKWVIPSKIHPADARPVGREVSLVNRDVFLRDGKYPARAENRDAFDTSFGLVCRVTRNDGFLFVCRIVLHVINGHNRLVTVV